MVFDDWMTRKDFNEIRENNPEFIDALKEVQTRIERRKDRQTGDIIETEWVKITLYDSQKAIELILKAMGWSGAVAEKLKIVNKTVNINQYTEDEKQVLLKIARNNEYFRESD